MKIRIISHKDDFLEYITNDGTERIIHYSDLQDYWSYATEEDQEGVCVYLQDNLIIGIMLVASAQGGIVFVWDANEHKLLHISDGSYSYAVLIHENFVYNICVISNFVTPARFALGRCEFGRLDAYKEFELIDCEFSCDVNDFDGDFGKIQLTHEGEDFFVILNGIKSKIDFNEDAEMYYEMEAASGRLVMVPGSKLDKWIKGQEAIKRGEKPQISEESLRKLCKLLDISYEEYIAGSDREEL